MVPGFAILSLDCLLIDTIQSFREGRFSTGEVSPPVLFKSFLKNPKFSDFNGRDREEFFHYVRNALPHNGETRKDWKIRFDTAGILEKTGSPVAIGICIGVWRVCWLGAGIAQGFFYVVKVEK
jgi:hypothetical protein